MTRNSNTILAIAIIGIGLYVLPSTLSMFAGQHSWYDPNNNGIPCEKCHWLESDELTSGAYAVHSPHRTASSPLECVDCHNVTMNITYYYMTGQAGDHPPAHAATTVSCLACHGELYSNGTSCAASCHLYGEPDELNVMHALSYKNNWGHQCDKCHHILPSDDLGDVPTMQGNAFIGNIGSNISNPLEGHRYFYYGMSGDNTTKSQSGLSGANEACLGCHTGTGVNISWNRCTNITFTANESSGDWAIDSIDATGTVTNFTSAR